MIEYYQKVADLWPHYGEIDSTIVHQAIVVSLINLEMTSVCLGTYPPEKGYQCWQAMKQQTAFPHVDAVHNALAELEDRDFIRELPAQEKRGPGRKPSPTYAVNPRALRG